MTPGKRFSVETSLQPLVPCMGTNTAATPFWPILFPFLLPKCTVFVFANYPKAYATNKCCALWIRCSRFPRLRWYNHDCKRVLFNLGSYPVLTSPVSAVCRSAKWFCHKVLLCRWAKPLCNQFCTIHVPAMVALISVHTIFEDQFGLCAIIT